MTFRKSKLIDNRPSWHPLRLCDKFGSQGDQIGTENLFQPSKQTGSFDAILAKREYCEPRLSRTEFVVQLYLFSSENRENESEECFKRCLPTSVSSTG